MAARPYLDFDHNPATTCRPRGACMVKVPRLTRGLSHRVGAAYRTLPTGSLDGIGLFGRSNGPPVGDVPYRVRPVNKYYLEVRQGQ